MEQRVHLSLQDFPGCQAKASFCGTLQGNEHFPMPMVLQGLLEQMIPLS